MALLASKTAGSKTAEDLRNAAADIRNAADEVEKWDEIHAELETLRARDKELSELEKWLKHFLPEGQPWRDFYHTDLAEACSEARAEGHAEGVAEAERERERDDELSALLEILRDEVISRDFKADAAMAGKRPGKHNYAMACRFFARRIEQLAAKAGHRL